MGKFGGTLSLLVCVALCVGCISAASVGNWGGVNSFFLHTLSASDRAAHLQAMQASGMRVLRIFISGVGKGAKGSSSAGSPELEPVTVGTYDDTALSQIDVLMSEVVKYNVKLEIMLHDRYSLGCWAEDAYVKKYNIKNTSPNCDTSQNQPRVFYVDGGAQADFDKRIVHVLTHKNPYFGNRAWGEISEAVFAFAPENEAQGHMSNPDWGWACRRAQVMRPYISKDIFISTGGGVDFPSSTVDNHFQCAQIDIVCMHDYSSSASYFTSQISAAKSKALSHGKRLIMEEFGSQGSDSNKASFYQSVVDAILAQGIPFLPWEFLKPSGGDYEFYTDSTQAWKAVGCRAQLALTQKTPFTWPLSDAGASNASCGGGGSKLPDWEVCTSSGQCEDGCCSSQYSGGVLKCTPNGCQCTGSKIGEWDFCSASCQCANSCCSKQFSDDGKLKCTPSGTQCV